MQKGVSITTTYQPYKILLTGFGNVVKLKNGTHGTYKNETVTNFSFKKLQ